MKSLLHWAIENSDPDKLRDLAEAASSADLDQRKQHVQELLAEMRKMPSEAELMKQSLEIISTAGNETARRMNALNFLEELVEPIDNANDLPKMDGFGSLVALIGEGLEQEQQAALLVLASAASNNVDFQAALLAHDPAAILKMMHVLRRSLQLDSARPQLAGAALRALAAMLRNSATAISDHVLDSCLRESGRGLPQQCFLLEVLTSLERVLQPSSGDGAHPVCGSNQTTQSQCLAVARKLLALIVDLSAAERGVAAFLASSAEAASSFTNACSNLPRGALDMVETALLLLDGVLKQDAGIAVSTGWLRVEPCVSRLHAELTKLAEEEDWLDDILVSAQTVTDRIRALRDATALPRDEL